jgi:hypothetical protein
MSCDPIAPQPNSQHLSRESGGAFPLLRKEKKKRENKGRSHIASGPKSREETPGRKQYRRKNRQRYCTAIIYQCGAQSSSLEFGQDEEKGPHSETYKIARKWAARWWQAAQV